MPRRYFDDDECDCVTCNTDYVPRNVESIPDQPFSHYTETIESLIEVREETP
jgi:hypothetical protein